MMKQSKMNKWFIPEGLAKEDEFGQLLVNKEGGNYTKASKEDDMYNHIDLYWKLDDQTYSFDVKSMKKHNRKDELPDDSIHWIELQNVQGRPGWLYGKMNYIAFETNDNWLIIEPKRILKLINEKVTSKEIVKTKELYTYYQRWGRQDIVVKVLTKDLVDIANKVIEK